VNIIDASFRDNAATSGGAIAGPTGATLSLTTTDLEGNLATGDGGAVFASTVSTTRCNFTGNLAERGGALAISGGDATFDLDTKFQENEAKRGGALAILTPNIASNGLFQDNGADYGGAAWLADGATFTTCSLVDNVAELEGGGVYTSGDATLRGVVFTGGLATRGGGLGTSGGDLTLDTCSFDENLATDEGGALHQAGGNVTFSGGRAHKNEAARGAAVWLKSGTFITSGADFGTGSTDNDPDDLAMASGEFELSSSATTCTTASGTCK
jgi:predicted outer membrane repeat protein